MNLQQKIQNNNQDYYFTIVLDIISSLPNIISKWCYRWGRGHKDNQIDFHFPPSLLLTINLATNSDHQGKSKKYIKTYYIVINSQCCRVFQVHGSNNRVCLFPLGTLYLGATEYSEYLLMFMQMVAH